MSNEAKRKDAGKLRFDLIPVEAKIELARVYTKGAEKYDDDNWRKGMDWSRCIGSLERHWNKWLAGQQFDEETGCHHLAMVAWNAFTLMYYQMRGVGKDNRHTVDMDDEFHYTKSENESGPEQPVPRKAMGEWS